MNQIIWSPSEVVVDLGFYAVHWYSLLFAVGFVAGYFLVKSSYLRTNIPLDKLDSLSIYVVLGTVIGARMGHCLFYEPDYYLTRPWEILLPFSFEGGFRFTGFRGLASHGGGIGLVTAIYIYSKRNELTPLWVMDQLALATPLVGAFIRLGNLMNSEIIGTPSSLPWAFVFERVDPIARHPAQLYEALAYFGVFIFMRYALPKSHTPGYFLGWCLSLIFTVRFFIEFIKIDQVAFEAGMILNMGQLLSLPFIVLGIYLIRNKKTEG
ncbi:MAG: prolipoprotein diacylglyceryl transferase [Cyclobacteriaceae bacterium]|nr:prolipoprotein diacylglyceryl transferase [Cyclobacteriaceae bacterium]